MFSSQKNVFWQALLVTLLIFGIGIVSGILLENWRVGKVDSLYQNSELSLLDIRLQTDIYSRGNFDCDVASKEIINFANRVYEEASVLERYETASRLTDDLIMQHKKYDILRSMLLLDSIKIREKCNSPYYEVVYFYKYNDPSLDVKAKQNVFSKMLKEIKDKKGDEVLLIPIAGNMNISSVNLILSSYDLSENDLPVILIDGKTKIQEIENVQELEKYFG